MTNSSTPSSTPDAKRMCVAVGADHAGVPLNERVIAEVERPGHAVIDFGTQGTSQPDDHLDYARSVGESVRRGEAERMIREDGVHGVTSNPTVFEKAIGGSTDYDDTLREVVAQRRSVEGIYERLVVDDIGRVAGLFRSLYDDEKWRLQSLLGKATIANAKLAYRKFKEIFEGERFAKLKAPGAHIQRPL